MTVHCHAHVHCFHADQCTDHLLQKTRQIYIRSFIVFGLSRFQSFNDNVNYEWSLLIMSGPAIQLRHQRLNS